MSCRLSPKFENFHPNLDLCFTLLKVLTIIVTFWFRIPSCWDSSLACKSSSCFLLIRISKLIGGCPLIQRVTRSKYSFASYITFVYLWKGFQFSNKDGAITGGIIYGPDWTVQWSLWRRLSREGILCILLQFKTHFYRTQTHRICCIFMHFYQLVFRTDSIMWS